MNAYEYDIKVRYGHVESKSVDCVIAAGHTRGVS